MSQSADTGEPNSVIKRKELNMLKISKPCVFVALSVVLFSLVSCHSPRSGNGLKSVDDGYVMLYNGKDLDNWKLMCRASDPELPKKVFTPGENGEIHVFRDFPDGYGVKTNKNETHGMMFTKKSYSRYSFKFEYKWGSKIYNNFDQYQYDAGCYYHTFEEKVWPSGIEYQVRYNHIENRNHTGDIWNSGDDFDWFAGTDKTYLPQAEGGVKQPHQGGEHRARTDAVYHGLDGQWNQCEIIVMGNQYAIHKLNGKVVNMLTNLKHGEGTIGLQSETAEIYYRNIRIKEFKEVVPAEVFLK
jgi:hypothetical protein